MLLSRFLAWMLTVGWLVLGTGAMYAQDYPNKAIRITTGPAGGGGDIVTRIVAQGISGPLGQPVIVDNRGSGFIAADAVYKQPADGYTLTLQGAALWIFPLLQKVSYDAVGDFSPILLISREVSVVVVHPSVPAKSVKEFIALAKARPGELNFSSATPGGASHLAGELFKHMAGINIVWVAYKGNAPAITALVSGEVQLTIIDAGQVLPLVKAGKLRALAATSAEPSALAPGLPTVAASGLPGYEAIGMTGLWAPAKTPVAIINRLNQEIVRVLRLPEVKEQLLNAGEEIVGSSPEQFASTIKADIAKWGSLIKDIGIKAQ